MNKVTIIGAGFGALNAVRRLRRLDRRIEIDLVAPRDVFVFYPGTIWIPTEDRRPEEFEVPLAGFFERHRIRWREGRVTGIREAGRRVVTDREEIVNDGLLIASGASFDDATPGREHAFLPCGGIGEMARLRDAVGALEGGTLAFGFSPHADEPSATRGGPVFELMLGLETRLRRERRRDRFRLVFFSPVRNPGERLAPAAARRLERLMIRRGIEVRSGERPLRFEAGRVVTDAGALDADLTVFMPGITGAPWFADTGLQRSPAGLLRADAFCRAPGVERVYVVGDAGSYDGPEWLPKRGHTAESQADAAARNLVAELRGDPPARRFKPDLVCVIDTRDRGILVVRTPRFAVATPALRPLHWAKRAFEWNYTRRFR